MHMSKQSIEMPRTTLQLRFSGKAQEYVFLPKTLFYFKNGLLNFSNGFTLSFLTRKGSNLILSRDSCFVLMPILTTEKQVH